MFLQSPRSVIVVWDRCVDRKRGNLQCCRSCSAVQWIDRVGAKCDVYMNNRNILPLLLQGNSFQSFDLKLVWVDENCSEKSAPGL